MSYIIVYRHQQGDPELLQQQAGGCKQPYMHINSPLSIAANVSTYVVYPMLLSRIDLRSDGHGVWGMGYGARYE